METTGINKRFNKLEKIAHRMEIILDDKKKQGASDDFIKGFKCALSYVQWRGECDRQYWKMKDMVKNEEHE